MSVHYNGIHSYANYFNNRDPNKRIHAKQSIVITGLGSPFFESYLDATTHIHHLFSRNITTGSLETWQPDSFEGCAALSLGNCYYTNRHDQGASEDLPFSADMDPHGILERGKAQQLVHLTENQIRYYELKQSSAGDLYVSSLLLVQVPWLQFDLRYKRVAPTKFREGDLIEAQVSFNAVVTRGNKHRLFMVLRAITLLDSKAVMVSLSTMFITNV